MVRWFRGWCPAGQYCRKQNAQACKKDSYEGCLRWLENHLEQSPYHKEMSADERTNALLEAVIEMDQASDEEWDVRESRAQQADYSREAATFGDVPSDNESLNKKVSELQGTVSKLVSRLSSAEMALKKRKGPSSSSADVSYDDDGGHETLALRPTAKARMVRVPLDTVRQCAESLGRAEQALRHAGTISMAASTAYNSEAGVVASARDRVASLLDAVQ